MVRILRVSMSAEARQERGLTRQVVVAEIAIHWFPTASWSTGLPSVGPVEDLWKDIGRVLAVGRVLLFSTGRETREWHGRVLSSALNI